MMTSQIGRSGIQGVLKGRARCGSLCRRTMTPAQTRTKANSVPIFVELTNIGTLFAFVLVCAGVMVLRHSDPHRARPFKTPWIPLLPIWLVIIYYLPYEILHDEWGKRLEHMVVLLLAVVGALFSLVGLYCKGRGR